MLRWGYAEEKRWVTTCVASGIVLNGNRSEIQPTGRDFGMSLNFRTSESREVGCIENGGFRLVPGIEQKAYCFE